MQKVSWIFNNNNNQEWQKEVLPVKEIAMKEFQRVLVAGSFCDFLRKKKTFSKWLNVKISAQIFSEFRNYSESIEFNKVFSVYFFIKCTFANEGVPLPCGQEELIQCSKQIRALTATSEFNFVDNKEELDRVCP